MLARSQIAGSKSDPNPELTSAGIGPSLPPRPGGAAMRYPATGSLSSDNWQIWASCPRLDRM